MMLLRLSLAIALLLGEIKTTADIIEYCRRELQDLCLQGELLDTREVKHYFTNPTYYLADLDIIRQRFQTLRYAPPASDVVRFSAYDRDTTYSLIQFNRGYKYHIEAVRLLYPDDQSLVQTLKEIEALYNVWDALRDATSPMYNINLRREGLLKLQRLLGEDYYRGVMPPVFPYWRFVEVR